MRTNAPPAPIRALQEFSTKTDLTRGLSSAVAQERFDTWGPNELAEKKVNPILLFLSYFWVRARHDAPCARH